MTRLRFDAAPGLYEAQAESLLAESQGKIGIEDARLTLARWYSFATWADMLAWSAEASREDSPVFRFEAAVEAVVDGDAANLRALLLANPDLVSARSIRVTPHDPPVHAATLLIYLGANGVEGYRQRTPPNAVEIARILLDAGADVNATANLYGGKCTTLSMLVSSCWPAQGGLQATLAEVLLDYGASLEDCGSGRWTSPLTTALVFGYLDTAMVLVRRGAQVQNLAAAAGLGMVEEAARRLPGADPDDRHRALALAAQLGHEEVVRMLLDAGEDPNRYNPDGFHSHGTPLHQAALAGHLDVVRLLVERGARADFQDKSYHATPLGWAEHGGKTETAEFLAAIC